MGCGNSKDSVDKSVLRPSKPQVVFVLGGPGSGKGTNCAKIVSDYGFVHLSAGDLLRAERKTGSENAKLIDEYIKEGKIVPVKVTVGLIRAEIERRVKEDSSMHFLVDGFPRNKDNLDGWYEVMGDSVEVAFVLFFECSEAVMEARLLERGKTSGRSDDNIESIKKRFRTFVEESMPIVETFRGEGKVRVIDAEQDVDKVYADVVAVFDGEIAARSNAAAGQDEEKVEVQTTFAWIKPDVVAAGKQDEMLEKIKEAGFEVVKQRRFTPSAELAQEFYAEHKGKPFYDGLVAFMSGGDAVALALRKPNAILAWRATLGPTNSNKAREESPGSLRALFGTDGSQNAGHGSDSPESAARELKLVFPEDF